MVSTSTNVNVFDKTLYETLSNIAAKYHRESPMINVIPEARLEFNVEQYKTPYYGESKNVHGGRPDVLSDKMETAKNYKIFELKDVYATLYWDQYDMMMDGQYLPQTKNEQLSEWARNAGISLFKGVYANGYNSSGVGQGAKLINGILDDATSVIDLDGTDSTLTTAAQVYYALNKFITSIPFRYASGKVIHLGMSPHFYEMANSATYTNTAGLTEWEEFMNKHVNGPSPYKVSPEIIFSNDLFLASTDTAGTHDRLFAFIADPTIIQRAYSRGFGMMGESINHVGGVTQTWTTKLAGCVIDPNAVIYSEQIAWA